jgi:predicted ATPase
VLRRLRIQNFKAWRDTGLIELAPLTVFFGPNSSGKSSLNHFLMMLRQTVRSADRNNVFDFGDASAAVSLGSFRDVVFGHDIENEISFASEWVLSAPLRIRDPRSGKRYAGSRLGFSASARQAGDRERTVQLERLEYRLSAEESDELQLSATLARDEKRTDRWRLETERYEMVRSPGRRWELPKPVQFYGFPTEAQLYFQNTAFLSDLELTLEERLSSISYLGPLRSIPERLYSWSGNDPLDVGWQGQNAVQAVLAGRERRLNWKWRSPTKPFEQVIAAWLVRLGLLHSFSVEPIAPDRDEYEVKVKTAPRSEEVKLTDVGFGVSQVLPVVVQCFYAAANSTVLIEQPEIHLHPSVQAALADLFIAAVRAREDSTDRGLQLIVESHSEHLLRRLQRRIAEGEISERDVALYFCYSGPNGSDMDRLEVNTYGDILNWPPDFFGDEVEDVAVQAEVGMQRKLALENE